MSHNAESSPRPISMRDRLTGFFKKPATHSESPTQPQSQDVIPGLPQADSQQTDNKHLMSRRAFIKGVGAAAATLATTGTAAEFLASCSDPSSKDAIAAPNTNPTTTPEPKLKGVPHRYDATPTTAMESSPTAQATETPIMPTATATPDMIATAEVQATATAAAQETAEALQPPTTMKEAAERNNEKIGALVGQAQLDDLFGKDKAYALVPEDYNQVSISSILEWGRGDGNVYSLHASESKFNFSVLDRFIDYAREKNDFSVLANSLIWDWSGSVPNWVKNGNYSPEQTLDILVSHINAVMTRTKGEMDVVSVVNEPIYQSSRNVGENYYSGLFGGLSYLDTLYNAAHEADPDAKLIWNEFDNHKPGPVADQQYEAAKGMLERNIPLHGIGFQTTVKLTDEFDPDTFTANMKRFTDLGLKPYITEFGVDISDAPGTEEEKLSQQADRAAQIVLAARRAGCEDFVFYGSSDAMFHRSGDTAEAYPRDKEGNKKPMYDAVMNALAAQL